jgi:hypothetical protein
MTVKLQGILTDVFPVEHFGNFSKRVFWLKEPDTLSSPQHYQLECHNDDVRRLDQYSLADKLECEVEIRGKKFSKGGKEFVIVSLKCVGILLKERLDAPGYVPKKGSHDDRQQAFPL